VTRIILGDNLGALRELVSEQGAFLDSIGKVQLIYMDPPFNTGSKQTGSAGSYEDKMLPLWDFTGALVERCALAWILLAESGCLVVHLDWRTVHNVKVCLDRALGVDHFASEIIWRYRRWPSKTQNFQRVHDTLLRYVKTPGKAKWNQLYDSPSVSTLATWGDRKQCAVVEDGHRKRSSVGDEPSLGVPMGDVWDISIVAPVAHERTGYPTQKPEALLERLILATTDRGDLVVDPYCGSGTALAVAKKCKRRAIGIDRNPEAVAISTARLAAIL
jgi:DNA modification methylase